MKKVKAVLVTAALVLTALVSTAPMASAEVGTRTTLKPEHREAWVHFRPALDSAYLVVSNVALRTICYIDQGNVRWNLIYDDFQMRTGYTYASYLTTQSTQWCGNVGQKTGGAKAETWVHLYPRPDWAYEAMYPGHDIAAVCTLGFITDPDGVSRRWDLYVDHANNVAGFTWYTSFWSSPLSITEC
ncbi:hypothetical protein ACXIZN_03615 [Amycolatopsis sp. TRM77291]